MADSRAGASCAIRMRTATPTATAIATATKHSTALKLASRRTCEKAEIEVGAQKRATCNIVINYTLAGCKNWGQPRIGSLARQARKLLKSLENCCVKGSQVSNRVAARVELLGCSAANSLGPTAFNGLSRLASRNDANCIHIWAPLNHVGLGAVWLSGGWQAKANWFKRSLVSKASEWYLAALGHTHTHNNNNNNTWFERFGAQQPNFWGAQLGLNLPTVCGIELTRNTQLATRPEIGYKRLAWLGLACLRLAAVGCGWMVGKRSLFVQAKWRLAWLVLGAIYLFGAKNFSARNCRAPIIGRFRLVLGSSGQNESIC